MAPFFLRYAKEK